MASVVNKMSNLLAALVVMGLVLLVSSAAEAHVNHRADSAGHTISLELPAVHAADVEGVGYGIETSTPAARPLITTLTDPAREPHGSADPSCCGSGMAGCSSGLAMKANCLPLLPLMGLTSLPLTSTALMGIAPDGLIRPPRVSV